MIIMVRSNLLVLELKSLWYLIVLLLKINFIFLHHYCAMQ